MSTCQLSLGVDSQITDADLLRNKLQELASRNIWSKLHEKVDEEEEIHKEIEEEIHQFWHPTENAIQELIDFTIECCQKTSNHHQNIEIEENVSEISGHTEKNKKKDKILKVIPIGSEIDSN